MTTLFLCKLFYYSDNNNIGEDGKKFLIEACKNWKKLTYLDIRENNIEFEIPNIEIHAHS